MLTVGLERHLAGIVVIYGYTPLAKRLPRSGSARSQVRLTYEESRGVLRKVLVETTGTGFAIAELQVSHVGGESSDGSHRANEFTSPSSRDPGLVSVVLQVTGKAE